MGRDRRPILAAVVIVADRTFRTPIPAAPPSSTAFLPTIENKTSPPGPAPEGSLDWRGIFDGRAGSAGHA
jgi:hypothetical protein